MYPILLQLRYHLMDQGMDKSSSVVDRIMPFFGYAPVGRLSSKINLQPRNPFVRRADLKIRGFSYNRQICGVAPFQLLPHTIGTAFLI